MSDTLLYFSLFGSILTSLFSLFVIGLSRKQLRNKEIKKISGQRERIEDKIYEWRDVLQSSPERFFDTNKILLQNPEKDLVIEKNIPNFQFFLNLGINIENVDVKENTVFCLMPFNDRYINIYHLIFYTCEEVGVSCSRSDDRYNPGNVLRQIISMMLESSIVIALLDGQNPNVFYEIGVAHSIGKTVLLLANQKGKNEIPFDLKSDRLLLYSDTTDLHDKLHDILKEMYYADERK